MFAVCTTHGCGDNEVKVTRGIMVKKKVRVTHLFEIVL